MVLSMGPYKGTLLIYPLRIYFCKLRAHPSEPCQGGEGLYLGPMKLPKEPETLGPNLQTLGL